MEEKRLLKFCDNKQLGVTNTSFQKQEKIKITCDAGGCETDIDFTLVAK